MKTKTIKNEIKSKQQTKQKNLSICFAEYVFYHKHEKSFKYMLKFTKCRIQSKIYVYICKIYLKI